MITYSAPASFSIVPLTSPVNAPSRSQCRVCPAMPMLEPCAASTAVWSAVNGGATTISTSCTSFTIDRNSLMKASVSWTLLCIFQFAVMNGVRMLLVRERRDARERPASEEFERRAAAGGDVRDAVGHARFRDRRDGIAAADDGRALHRCDRLRDLDRPVRERVDLEHA